MKKVTVERVKVGDVAEVAAARCGIGDRNWEAAWIPPAEKDYFCAGKLRIDRTPAGADEWWDFDHSELRQLLSDVIVAEGVIVEVTAVEDGKIGSDGTFEVRCVDYWESELRPPPPAPAPENDRHTAWWTLAGGAVGVISTLAGIQFSPGAAVIPVLLIGSIAMATTFPRNTR